MPHPFQKKEAIQKKAIKDWSKLARKNNIPKEIIDKVTKKGQNGKENKAP